MFTGERIRKILISWVICIVLGGIVFAIAGDGPFIKSAIMVVGLGLIGALLMESKFWQRFAGPTK